MKRYLAAALVSVVMLAGCNQNTTAALVGIAGTAISSLETIEGHTDAAVKIQTDFTAAQAAVLNWKAGTPTQDVAQALTLVQNDLNLLPVTNQDVAYVNLAIGTIQSILVLFPQAATPNAVIVPHAQVQLAVVPKTASEFKVQWNAIPGNLAPIK